tara:strand:+ start:299 stop:466 length:168 start_codon:yes stop_codon:yes gene_type:complete
MMKNHEDNPTNKPHKLLEHYKKQRISDAILPSWKWIDNEWVKVNFKPSKDEVSND